MQGSECARNSAARVAARLVSFGCRRTGPPTAFLPMQWRTPKPPLGSGSAGGSVAVEHADAADAVDRLRPHRVQHLLLLRLRARLLLLELPLHLLLLQVEVESTELVGRGLREGGGGGEKGGENDKGFMVWFSFWCNGAP